jgi:hypothetical protein
MFKHIVALNTYTEPFLSLKANEQRTIIEQLLGITLLSEKADALKEQSIATKDAIQQEEYNITSWFVSRSIKQFRKDTKVKAIISYADSDFHDGTIYRACNFRYCGLTDAKKDFYYADGTKHSRGKMKGAAGEWRDRSRKHRYVMMFDKKLKLLWTDETSVLSAN